MAGSQTPDQLVVGGIDQWPMTHNEEHGLGSKRNQHEDKAEKMKLTSAMLYLLPVNLSSSVKPCNLARPTRRQHPNHRIIWNASG